MSFTPMTSLGFYLQVMQGFPVIFETSVRDVDLSGRDSNPAYTRHLLSDNGFFAAGKPTTYLWLSCLPPTGSPSFRSVDNPMITCGLSVVPDCAPAALKGDASVFPECQVMSNAFAFQTLY